MSGVVVLNARSTEDRPLDPVHELRSALETTAEPAPRIVAAFVGCVACADGTWLAPMGVGLRERAAALIAAALRESGIASPRAHAEVVVRLAVTFAVAPPLGGDAHGFARRVLLPMIGSLAALPPRAIAPAAPAAPG